MFEKIDGKWYSETLFHDNNFFKLVKLYQEKYPNSVINEKYIRSESSAPGWPNLCYYKIIIEFNNDADEAEFILKESK